MKLLDFSWMKGLTMLGSSVVNARVNPVGIDQRPVKRNLPNGRVSHSDYYSGVTPFTTNFTQQTLEELIRFAVPQIRHLMMTNEDVGQVLHNICTLGNTGHKIFFDRKVSPEQVDKMRNHLINKRKTWATGQAGMDGTVNKMFYQVLIGGALSNEWVPNKSLTGIENIVFLNPENTKFLPKKNGTGYDPFQRIKNGFSKTGPQPDLVPLNPNTYKYFALNGDTDLPYGIPPYIPVIPKVATQGKMNKNIEFIVDEFGLIGFLEVLLQKPDQVDEGTLNEAIYDAKLDSMLVQAKQNLQGGMKDGLVVGWKDDHEFNFNSFSKDYKHVNELYNMNELGLFSALKHDATLAGRNYNSSETQISVVFMKMLSELRNIQNIIKTNLEFGYALELMLAGFSFDYLTVKFNRSTIQDDLKYQQAEEIKIRNVKDKMIMGLIDQNQAADELDYEEPAHAEPMVSWDVLAGGSDPNTNDNAAAKQEGQKVKDANDRKNRQKAKPVSKVTK